MKRILLVTLAIVTVTPSIFTQEKRALLIAINKYAPPANYNPSNTAGRINFANLDGSINDAKAMESIILSRFQFSQDRIATLYDEDATRDNIIKGLETLLENSRPGDVAFIFYAGHGSQVLNTKSKEDDQRDETIVPCDTWKQGVRDIRDKELAAVFNRYIDKGVKLTVIMDCCHSGSMSRGPNEPAKSRYIAEENWDANDGSSPVPPETRPGNNFLIFSASQDNESAMEQLDDNRLYHGAFTIAFVQALDQLSNNASAQNLFTSLRAILKSNGKKQEPVLGGSRERKQQTLFGLATGTLPDKSLIAVAGFEKGKVVLQGGFALGIYKENELVKFNGRDTLVKLRVDTVTGINKSLASVIKGKSSDLRAGDFVEVTNWASSGGPMIKIYIPSNTLSFETVNKLAALDADLKKSKKIKWTNDLEKDDPYVSVFYSGDKCYANIDGSGKKEQSDISSAGILKLCKQDSSLYFELPPYKELATVLTERLKQNRNFALVNNVNEANYSLYGTIDEDGKPAYGLRKAQASSRDSLESMPVQTKSFTLQNNNAGSFDFISDSLYEYALRLAKIRGWLQLAGPASPQTAIPYDVEIFNEDSGKVMNNGSYRIGDNISVRLSANANYTSYTGGTKFVYVFAADKSGRMALYYPREDDGNVSNKFPKYEGNKLIREVTIYPKYEVGEPSGTDNFFLLATNEAIPNYDLVFNQEGVRGSITRGVTTQNPLYDLLDMGNEGSRGVPPKLPATWSLKRVSMRCLH